MPDQLSLSNHLLIAMPNLPDPNFSRSVTLICEHNADGALGVTINRQLDMTIRDIFQQLKIDMPSDTDQQRFSQSIYMGGPVQENRGFIIHEPLGQWESTLAISENLGASASQDILQAIANNHGPSRYIMAIGYAGWGPGQLEQEIAENSWLNVEANNDFIFDTPADQRWQAAVTMLGLDLATLSSDAGHA